MSGYEGIVAKPSLDSNEAWAFIQAARRQQRHLRDAAERAIEERGGYVENPKDTCLLDRAKLIEECP